MMRNEDIIILAVTLIGMATGLLAVILGLAIWTVRKEIKKLTTRSHHHAKYRN